MKKITSIEQQKRNKDRYNIYLAEHFAFGVCVETLLSHNMKEGDELDDDFVNQVLKVEEQNKAVSFAMHFLTARKRSEKEVSVKMKQKGYEEDLIEHTLIKLREFGYIDDKDFTQSLINDRRNLKKVGKRLLVQELRMKGIDTEIIEELVSESATDDSEYENALALAGKKAENLSGEDPRSIKNKLYQFLLRKGYSSNIITRVLRQLAVGGSEE